MTKSELKTFVVSAISGSLELYDFILYIFFAKIIAQLFFNTSSQISSLLLAFTVYSSGFIARILGGLFFSNSCDKNGRKQSFSVTIFIMAIATFCIGCLPTYQSVGSIATVLLIGCRLLQGVALGAELPCSLTFVYEHAKENKKALACGMVCIGIAFGVFLGSFIGSLVTKFSTPENLISYGWRIPFMFGGLLGIVGVYLRKNLNETPVFIQLQKEQKTDPQPFKSVLKNEKTNTLHSVFIILLTAVSLALIFLYAPVYLQIFYKFSPTDTLIANSIFILVYAALIPVFGVLCDKYGEKSLFMLASFFMMLFSIPMYLMLKEGNVVSLYRFYFILSILSSAIKVSSMTILVKQFLPRVRYTGVSFSYNLAFGVMGGFTPIIATKLIDTTHLNYAPGFYLAFVSLLGFISCLSLKRKERHQDYNFMSKEQPA